MDLIGLAAMVYEPIYHARQITKLKRKQQYFLIVFNKTIIPLALVGYEMI